MLQVAFERIFEVLDLDIMINDKPNALELKNLKGEIEFDNVSFSYSSLEEQSHLYQLKSAKRNWRNNDSGEEINFSGNFSVKNLSFKVNPGQGIKIYFNLNYFYLIFIYKVIALVGKTGSGK